MPETLFPESFDEFKSKTAHNIHDLSMTPITQKLVSSGAPNKSVTSKMGDA